MKIAITDIPPEGRDLSFDIDEGEMNARLRDARERQSTRGTSPDYHFLPHPKATTHLNLEGQTVVINGNAEAQFVTECSRCADETTKSLTVPIKMILKPSKEDIEDVQIGSYDGRDVDLGPIVEESLLLSLPYTVVCSPECKGLCQRCGKNLNLGPCECAPVEKGDERLAVLKTLKIH